MSMQSATASPCNQSLTRTAQQYSDKPRSSQNSRAIQPNLPIVEGFSLIGIAPSPSSVLLQQVKNEDVRQTKSKEPNGTSEKYKKRGQLHQDIENKGQIQANSNILPGSANSNGTQAHKSKNICQNLFCPREKGLLHLLDPSSKHGNGMKQVKLKNTGEKVSMCEACASRYLDLHFCWFCQQVYFDEYNIDEKVWIQCDTCDRWTHLNCEDETIKKAFGTNSSENVNYECPRCRAEGPKQLPKQTKANSKKQDKLSAKLDKKNEKQEGFGIEKQQQQQQIQQIIQQHSNKQEKGSTSAAGGGGSFGSRGGLQVSAQKQEMITTPSKKRSKLSCRHDEDSTANIQQSSSIQQHNMNGHNNSNSDNGASNYYSLEMYKRAKLSQAVLPQVYQKQPPPSFVLYGYQTLEDLLKQNGLSLSLDESNIRSDLSQMKQMLLVSASQEEADKTEQNEKAKVLISIHPPV